MCMMTACKFTRTCTQFDVLWPLFYVQAECCKAFQEFQNVAASWKIRVRFCITLALKASIWAKARECEGIYTCKRDAMIQSWQPNRSLRGGRTSSHMFRYYRQNSANLRIFKTVRLTVLGGGVGAPTSSRQDWTGQFLKSKWLTYNTLNTKTLIKT